MKWNVGDLIKLVFDTDEEGELPMIDQWRGNVDLPPVGTAGRIIRCDEENNAVDIKWAGSSFHGGSCGVSVEVYTGAATIQKIRDYSLPAESDVDPPNPDTDNVLNDGSDGFPDDGDWASNLKL